MNDDTGFDRQTDVVVVGAGIAGLVSAVTAAQAGARVTVLEANDLGGRARTAQRDGFALNIGPHALYNEGRLRQMLTAQHIDLPGGSVAGRGLGLVRNGERHQVTISAVGLAKSPVMRPRSRAKLLALFARLPRMNPNTLAGRTVRDWLGDEPDDVQQFVQAFVRVSSYTHAPDVHDAGAAVAQVQLAFQGVRYLDGGWMSIVDALTARALASGVKVHAHAPVSSVVADGRRAAVSANGDEIAATAVVIATGGPDLVSRLTGTDVANRHAISAPVRATTLDLATRRAFPDCFTLGMDRPVYLSPHAPAARLAPDGCGLVSAMRYLAPGEDAGDPAASRDELRGLAQLAGIDDADVLWERSLHQNVVTHGSPTAAGGGLAERPRIDALGVAGLYVAGDWVGPVGALADASAASGVEAGLAAARHCASISA